MAQFIYAVKCLSLRLPVEKSKGVRGVKEKDENLGGREVTPFPDVLKFL